MRFHKWDAAIAREIHEECDKMTAQEFVSKAHWFCKEHQAVTRIQEDGPRNVCAVCGSPRIQHCPALDLEQPPCLANP